MSLSEDGELVFFHGLIPNCQEGAVTKFNSAGISEIAPETVTRNGERFAPGSSVVDADSSLIPEGGAAVSVGHQKPSVAQLEKVGRQPITDGARHAPGFAAVC